MKSKETIYEEKIKRIQHIKDKLPIKDSIFYSLDDLKDAYLETKATLLKERMDLVIDKLEMIDDKKDCHYLYRELEDLEEMLYLIEKKFSKEYKKAKKYQTKTSDIK